MHRILIRVFLLCVVAMGAGVALTQAQSGSGAAQPPANAATGSGNTKPAGNTPSAAGTAQPSAHSPASGPTLADAAHLFATGKLDAAAREYTALLTPGPDAPLAYAGLARVLLRQKKPVDAYTAAAKAVDLGPTYPAAHVALGEVYFRQGKIPEAEREFITLVRAGTPNAGAYLGMARISRASSYYKQAKRLIDRAYELDPADPDIRKAWLGYLSLAERIKALQAYLAGESNDDAEEHSELEHQLVVLQDEAGQPTRPCRLVSKVSSMQTDLRQLLIDARHIRGYGLSVKLNGTPSKLMLDTGAGGILVDRPIAEKAGIKRIVQTSIAGIGDKGEVPGYVGYADSIQIGDLEFQDCYVEVMEKRSVLDDDGLIGADVFSHFLVDIDLPNGKFRLSQLPPRPDEPATPVALESRSRTVSQFHDRYIAPEMQSFSPVYRFGHELLIPTKLTDSPPKLFLIDTGSLFNTIAPAAAEEVTKVSSDSNLQVKGLSGSVNRVFRANELTLTFGHLRQKNQDMVSFDMAGISNSTGTEVSGTFGFAMLRLLEVKIDYRDGLVDFVYDANRRVY